MDIAVDSQANPQLLQVVVKQNPSDKVLQFVYDKPPCDCHPSFLAIKGNQNGPLFMLKDGRMLTRKLFSTFLDDILSKLQFNQSHLRLWDTHELF